MRRLLSIGCCLACLIVIAAPITAQDSKSEGKHGGYGGGAHEGHRHGEGQPPAGQQPGDAEMAKMMEQMMKLAAPGEHHAHLNPLAGDWEIVGKFRMTPEMPWETSKSTCHAEWILGNRFLTQTYKGEPMPGMPPGMDKPFEGFGIMGYDNMKKQYVSAWGDNMGTMLMTAEGECDGSGKTITTMSKFNDCMTGKPTWMRSVYKIESNDRYVLTIYGPGPDGKEFLSMELVHTRKKAG